VVHLPNTNPNLSPRYKRRHTATPTTATRPSTHNCTRTSGCSTSHPTSSFIDDTTGLFPALPFAGAEFTGVFATWGKASLAANNFYRCRSAFFPSMGSHHPYTHTKHHYDFYDSGANPRGGAVGVFAFYSFKKAHRNRRA
jgi:hypothetical protein